MLVSSLVVLVAFPAIAAVVLSLAGLLPDLWPVGLPTCQPGIKQVVQGADIDCGL